MKIFHTILASAFSFLTVISSHVFSQEKPTDSPSKQNRQKCATQEMTALSDQQHPRLKKLRDSLFQMSLKDIREGNTNRRSGTVYTIPVVVHVIHNNSSENIYESQVKSQFETLINDYRKIAGTLGDGNGVDTEIQFQLANIDMYGNYTTGVEKIKSTLTTHYKTKDRGLKDLSRWDPHKYLNVYIVKDIISSDPLEEVLGYAFRPPAFPLTDGIVIRHTAFGTTGTVLDPSTLGRTATHEMGHYLGLQHPWGDIEGDCSEDDGITDTPNCDTICFFATSPSCQTVFNCGNTCQIENYMDYSDDGCVNMFTAGQNTQMRNVLSQSAYGRTSLVTSSNQKATGVSLPSTGVDAWALVVTSPAPRICNAIFIPKFMLKNNGSENITSCAILYKLDNKIIDTLNFTGSITPAVSKEMIFVQDTVITKGSHTIIFTIQNPNGGADVLNSNNTVTFSFDYTDSIYAIPYKESFETSTFPPSGWKRYDPNSNNKWERAAKGAFGTSNYSARMDNYNPFDPNLSYSYMGQVDYLLSPHFDLTNVQSPYLKFSVAYAASSSTMYDKLSVFISTNCSDTWIELYAKTGYTKTTNKLPTADTTTTSFAPTNSQWRTETISLAAYIGNKDVMFKVESQYGWGNMLYMDDFTVDGQIISGMESSVVNNDHISIFPNPSNGLYNLQINLLEESNVKVDIYNYLGIKTSSIFNGKAKSKNLPLDLNDKPAGIYMVVTDIRGKKMMKMIVNQ